MEKHVAILTCRNSAYYYIFYYTPGQLEQEEGRRIGGWGQRGIFYPQERSFIEVCAFEYHGKLSF